MNNDNDANRLLGDVLISLEKLKEKGSFFISAIELDFDFDGEEYKKELDAIIVRIRQHIA